MKYLIVLAIVFLGFWLWRSNRPAARGEPPPARKPDAQLQDMVSCAVCDVHVPRADAMAGRRGELYCSIEHRQRAEG